MKANQTPENIKQTEKRKGIYDKGASSVPFAILCDFDGTILNVDTCVVILQKFAKEDWRIYDDQLERGEITLQECLNKQFSTVTVSKARVLKEVETDANFRPGFEKLVEYCVSHQIPLILISAGLDFVIKHFLKSKGWEKAIKVYAPKAKLTKQGIKFAFPKLSSQTSVNFKEDFVKRHRREGCTVIYIGDGLADYLAAKSANLRFAIKHSKLAELLQRHQIAFKEISDFEQVVAEISAEIPNTKHTLNARWHSLFKNSISELT
jgi:2-hydroxy-3-keto-5-methylthiopentenyl-1-phosphate phosphatase